MFARQTKRYHDGRAESPVFRLPCQRQLPDDLHELRECHNERQWVLTLVSEDCHGVDRAT
jgi:hypothetical protein